MSRRRNNKKKNDKSLLGFILKLLLIVLNCVAAFTLLMALLSAIFPPAWIMLASYCGLAFPYLLFINLGFVFIWLFIDYKYALISLILVLANINNIDKCFQLRATEKPEVCANCLKVMSYNAKLFGLYETDDKFQRKQARDEIFRLFRKEQPDILCIQEYFWDSSGKLNFNTRDSILAIMHIRDAKRNSFEYFHINNKAKNYHYGTAIFCKYKIVNADYVDLGDSSSNTAIFVDIKFKADTLRIYNVHLASIHMDVEDYAMGREIASNGIDDPYLDMKAKILYKKVGNAFTTRQHQVKALRAHIDSCQYPVIICGDFNDSPVSYAYHKVGHGLKDAFRESGGGRGQTYAGDAFPSFRIDYIFHDKQYNSFGYTTCDSLKVSDHYPIFTNISILK